LSFKSTGNFVLQIGPCSFLYLRIDPWGSLFILLLYFFLLGISVFASSAGRTYPFLSLSSTLYSARDPALQASRRLRAGGSASGAAPRRRARASARRGPSGSGGAARERAGRLRPIRGRRCGARALSGPSGRPRRAGASAGAERCAAQQAVRARAGVRNAGAGERTGRPQQELAQASGW
jgi:hypothetical protein